MDEERPPRTGGTIERPGRLYPPGTGTGTVCGTDRLPTHGGGRLGSHGSHAYLDTDGHYRRTTCPGSWRPVVTP